MTQDMQFMPCPPSLAGCWAGLHSGLRRSITLQQLPDHSAALHGPGAGHLQ
eukprot:CAMPEP_0174288376 /NCGR_PEP_ID=MMETSP0809-20121228/20351_1 /TAXON_ID=73025 ORGANISM="Eutreptiella gymnastica-like, Strain CCMP1594" /NCGR_SAMPLE_ID=MMETSP0809 /ASSEMBLY_ACC=CAM_ASM_000658 /LENGTH=50 /DNA_ID=CAMNT_0015385511 /DNA_START=669 /DNA_END=821 /DNA_ORIENTATION=-